MLKIEQFVEQHFGIKLMPHQLEIIAQIAANPEEKFTIVRPTPKAAGKTTAYKAAIAYLQDGLKPLPTGSIRKRALEWALSDDTGTSSETMCCYFTGSPMRRWSGAPSDAADRGRCIRLLKLIPEWVERLDELKSLDVGTVSINGADPIPRSQDTHSWTHQIPLIIEEGGFKL